MNVRILLWIIGLAYAGFLLAGGRNAPSQVVAISATVVGAMVGLGLGMMFARRARRKHT